MKNYNWLVTACIILISLSGYAQTITKDSGHNEDNYKNLQIGCSKTTSIVFPYAVKTADKGSADILVQKARGAENILLLKAAKQYFPQTNLTVVTADSRLYVFVLNYNDACPDLNIKVDHTAVVNDDIVFSLDHENQKKIEQNATLALSKNKKVSGLKKTKYEMKITVNGIFIHQDVIYFRMALGNTSKINYDIDQLRFFIRDQKKSKRTASQEIEILPLYSTYNSSVIADKSEVSMVYAFSKFTIPEKKYLTIQLMEKNGGRHIEINVKNTDLTHLDILNGF